LAVSSFAICASISAMRGLVSIGIDYLSTVGTPKSSMAPHSHLNSMDVTLLICCHPGNFFQASVIALEAGRRWSKVYPSKQECLAELCQIGLLSIWDQDAVLKSDFDKKDRVLIVRSNVEPEVLAHADFVEMTSAKVN
jgi:hypothetical protein